MSRRRVSRRNFLATTSAAAGASLLIGGTRASGNFQGASERVRIGVVGCGGRGGSHIGGWTGEDNVEVAYLVDPEERNLSNKLRDLTRRVDGKYRVQGVADVRRVLDDPTVDAISVATPNHWHSLMTIWAAQHGKHVYVEKPMSHDVVEGRVAMEAQKKYGVVVQHGTQTRSNARVAGLHEAINAGKFGKLKISYGYCCKPRDSIGLKSPTAAPANLDWDLWRGPAVIDQYHDNYVHYNWHWFWESGNGDLNNQGTHQLDVARWALEPDQTSPVRVMALGNRFVWNDQGETPNTMFAIAEYPNGQFVYFNVRNVNYGGYERQVENEYYFEDGGMIKEERRGYVYYPAGSRDGERVDVQPGDVTPGGNWGAFIAAIRAGDPSMANGTAEEAHYGCLLGHLMNNSYRLGRKVPFNAKAGGFAENSDAQEHFEKLHEIMNKGVGVPENETDYIVGPWLAFDPVTERHTGSFAHEANALLKNFNRAGYQVPGAANV